MDGGHLINWSFMRTLRVLLPIALVVASVTLAAAVTMPKKINFQGKLVDPATNNPKTGTFSMTFKLYKSPNGGTVAYTEVQPNVLVTNGVFSVQIGTVTALDESLFADASTYLGVTVAPDAEMTPLTQLIMAPSAFTASQLTQDSDILIAPGLASSTFTATGDLVMGGGIFASSATYTYFIKAASGTFTGGVTASSGTFTATGASQYSVATTSGILINNGTLTLSNTSAGIDAVGTGISLSTIDFSGLAVEPAGNTGFMYYNTSTGAIKVFDGSGAWAYVFGQSLSRKTFFTTSATAAIVVNKPANAAIYLQPFYLPGPMMINQMQCDITTALGAAGDIGVYNNAGTLVLNGGANTLTVGAGLKTVAPVQAGNARFLPPGQYWAAITYNSTTGRFAGDTLAVAGIIPGIGTIAAGGGTTLPASVTLSTIVNGTVMFLFEMNP
jgi:hypothetical protein